MKGLVLGILFLSLALSSGVVFLASTAPDGLDSTLQQIGIKEPKSVIFEAWMPDYRLGCSLPENAGRVLAGVFGICAVLGFSLLFGWLIKKIGKKATGGD